MGTDCTIAGTMPRSSVRTDTRTLFHTAGARSGADGLYWSLGSEGRGRGLPHLDAKTDKSETCLPVIQLNQYSTYAPVQTSDSDVFTFGMACLGLSSCTCGCGEAMAWARRQHALLPVQPTTHLLRFGLLLLLIPGSTARRTPHSRRLAAMAPPVDVLAQILRYVLRPISSSK